MTRHPIGGAALALALSLPGLAGAAGDARPYAPAPSGDACLERHWVPPVTEMVVAHRDTAHGRTVAEYVPPVTRSSPRTVLVRPAIPEWRIVPARYEMRRVRVLVAPAHDVIDTIPALTESRLVRVQVRPARSHYVTEHSKWGEPRRVLRHEEAVWEEQVRTVVVRPESRVRRHVPAQYRVEERMVEVAPERRERIVHPEIRRTVQDPVVVQRGQVIARRVPDAGHRVVREVVTEPGRWEWRRRAHCD